jgi:hypothetical protein
MEEVPAAGYPPEWSSRTGRRPPPERWSPGPTPDHLPRPGGGGAPPAGGVRDIRRYRTRSGSVKVNLALGELPAPTAWDGPVPGDPHRGLIAIYPSVEYLERALDEAKYGGTSSDLPAQLAQQAERSVGSKRQKEGQNPRKNLTGDSNLPVSVAAGTIQA